MKNQKSNTEFSVKDINGTVKVCPICGKVFNGFGNNGRPVVNSSDVCDECNHNVVLKYRSY